MAAWRHPDGVADSGKNLPHLIELAQLAERGLFDMFFMADSVSFWRGTLDALSRDSHTAWIEPFTLMGALANALAAHYGVAEDALSFLRAEAARADEVDAWVAHLIDKYFMTADAYTVFEARRAMREAGWAWTALTEAEG